MHSAGLGCIRMFMSLSSFHDVCMQSACTDLNGSSDLRLERLHQPLRMGIGASAVAADVCIIQLHCVGKEAKQHDGGSCWQSKASSNLKQAFMHTSQGCLVEKIMKTHAGHHRECSCHVVVQAWTEEHVAFESCNKLVHTNA